MPKHGGTDRDDRSRGRRRELQRDAAANIDHTATNLSSSLANIQDVDVAPETANLAREQVLGQAGVSVLSQANQAPQLALKLLGP